MSYFCKLLPSAGPVSSVKPLGRLPSQASPIRVVPPHHLGSYNVTNRALGSTLLFFLLPKYRIIIYPDRVHLLLIYVEKVMHGLPAF